MAGLILMGLREHPLKLCDFFCKNFLWQVHLFRPGLFHGSGNGLLCCDGRQIQLPPSDVFFVLLSSGYYGTADFTYISRSSCTVLILYNNEFIIQKLVI